jgi:putative ATP-dependent endonuclease of OLD family
MFLSKLFIEGFRLFGSAFELNFRAGLNVLVGENDAGKTAIIDAIRFALGTTSQDFPRVTEDDFHFEDAKRAAEFTIRCRFAGIDKETGGPLMEHLSYEDGKACLYITFHATRNEALSTRRRITVDVRSGRGGTGPQLDGNARLLLQATYLRPLRDAEHELDSGRNSRLSQILQHTKEIVAHKDEAFDPAAFVAAVDAQKKIEFPKSITNVSRLADHLIQENEGVSKARERLDANYLAKLNLGDESLGSWVSVGQEATPDQRLRSILEKLELRLSVAGDTTGQLPHGLGYNNLLFMACELLLLGQDEDTLPLLLIEEPEAHLHPQLQLRLVEFLQEQAAAAVGRQVQVILTTHSPNLASKVKLTSMILVCQGRAFPLQPEGTLLSETDYRFLERFLDVTKANLFFARGVLVVEGDAEAMLLPTLARLLGRDLTRYGISVVNVGSRGLRRYARIFRRKLPADGKPVPAIPIRVACLADRDIMPDCAKEALALDNDGEQEKKAKRRKTGPRFEADLPDDVARQKWSESRCRDDGENVRTFVSNQWTLEYDLAHAGLGCELFEAIALAKVEARLDRVQGKNVQASDRLKIIQKAARTWEQLKLAFADRNDRKEYLACKAYADIYDGLSKPTVTQHLASLLDERYGPTGTLMDRGTFATLVPSYIRNAIDYMTGGAGLPASTKTPDATSGPP